MLRRRTGSWTFASAFFKWVWTVPGLVTPVSGLGGFRQAARLAQRRQRYTARQPIRCGRDRGVTGTPVSALTTGPPGHS
jgi:hypothetical protein